mgnify:CR=1 FL=1
MNGLGICIIGIRKISNEDAAGIPLAVMDEQPSKPASFHFGQGFPDGYRCQSVPDLWHRRTEGVLTQESHEDRSTFYHREIPHQLISYLYFILYDSKIPL